MSRINKPFVVIHFKKLPKPCVSSIECVPKAWIKCYNDYNHVTVSFPDNELDQEALDTMIRLRKTPLHRWPLFPATLVAHLDSEKLPYIQAYIRDSKSLNIAALPSLIKRFSPPGTDKSPKLCVPSSRHESERTPDSDTNSPMQMTSNNSVTVNDSLQLYNPKRVTFAPIAEHNTNRHEVEATNSISPNTNDMIPYPVRVKINIVSNSNNKNTVHDQSVRSERFAHVSTNKSPAHVSSNRSAEPVPCERSAANVTSNRTAAAPVASNSSPAHALSNRSPAHAPSNLSAAPVPNNVSLPQVLNNSFPVSSPSFRSPAYAPSTHLDLSSAHNISSNQSPSKSTDNSQAIHQKNQSPPPSSSLVLDIWTKLLNSKPSLNEIRQMLISNKINPISISSNQIAIQGSSNCNVDSIASDRSLVHVPNDGTVVYTSSNQYLVPGFRNWILPHGSISESAVYELKNRSLHESSSENSVHEWNKKCPNESISENSVHGLSNRRPHESISENSVHGLSNRSQMRGSSSESAVRASSNKSNKPEKRTSFDLTTPSNKRKKLNSMPELIRLSRNPDRNPKTNTTQQLVNVDIDILVKIVQLFDELKPLIDHIPNVIHD